MSRRSLVRSDHLAPHSKSIQSFRGGCMHVCECCALTLIIFALSFCSLCVSKVNGSFLGYIQISDVSQPRSTDSFTCRCYIYSRAAAATSDLLVRISLSAFPVVVPSFFVVHRCCFFCVRSRTFRHAISGQSNCRIYLLQLHMYNNWNEHTRRRFND